MSKAIKLTRVADHELPKDRVSRIMEENRERNYRRGYRDGYIAAVNDMRPSQHAQEMQDWSLYGELLEWYHGDCTKEVWAPGFEARKKKSA